ncbi:hypothetical protein BGX38DRAFT_1281849 [Terfezia claveryi]|nr:hypothetical protein BGX38DRAFT_1281849 [Terfezia claveryi]
MYLQLVPPGNRGILGKQGEQKKRGSSQKDFPRPNPFKCLLSHPQDPSDTGSLHASQHLSSSTDAP